jgi:hypothetical protein
MILYGSADAVSDDIASDTSAARRPRRRTQASSATRLAALDAFLDGATSGRIVALAATA